MSDWVRWVLIGLAVVLVIALLAYARGERQRGDVEPEASATVIGVATDATGRLVLSEGSWS